MTKVFVVQEVLRRSALTGELEPAQDFSSAQEYGEMRVLFRSPRPIGAMGGNEWYARMVDDIRNNLEDYEDGDYLLPAGSPAAIAIAGALAADLSGGHLKVLCWNKRDRSYETADVILWDDEVPSNADA